MALRSSAGVSGALRVSPLAIARTGRPSTWNWRDIRTFSLHAVCESQVKVKKISCGSCKLGHLRALNHGKEVGRLLQTVFPRLRRAHPLAHIVCEIPSIILRHSQRRLLLSSRAGTSPPRAHTRGSTTTLADGVVVRHGGKPQRRETRDALHPVPRDALAHTACFSPPS